MNNDDKIQNIKIEDIIPNRFQPRERFDEDGLEDLANSIKEHGVIQPIIVRKLGDKYELIAGERRTKASSLAGFTTIPAIIREMDDKESAKISILENLQRKNLTAIEEAKTYKRILELENMTQDELARTMGRSQPMVANKLRLLSLPEEIQEALVKNQISERHARSLLTIKDRKEQLIFLDRIKRERLTVRELDKEIKKYKDAKENNLEEKDEERIMNNNRSNFGGMGLNDYQTGVGNNMFNNIPNNFNNMAFPTEENKAESYDYGDFGGNDNSFNNQSMPVSGNNGMNIGQNESLGSMFDGGMNQTNNSMNNMMDNSDENNVFISQIREDNLPKKENQFLPNFDDDINDNSQNNFSMNNDFNNPEPTSSPIYNQPMNNSFFNNMETMNYNTGMDSTPSNDMNIMNQNLYTQPMDMGMNYNQPINNYNEVNNMGPMNSNEFIPNSNYQQNNTINNQMPMGNQDMYFNSMNMEMQKPQPFTPQVNNDYAMNSIDSYNPYNKQNDNRIPDYGNGVSYQNPNGGNLFNQPLNIVGPYGAQPMPEQPIQTQPMDNSMPMGSLDMSGAPMPMEQPLPMTSPNPLEEEQPIEESQGDYKFEQPIQLSELEETQQEQPKLGEENEEVEIEKPVEENQASIPEIELIDDNDEPVSTKENEEEQKRDYIRLDDEITMHNVHDAVLELKKTTDKIKRNHIDIDTEEVEFDDVYQITIKIKKEEN